MKKKKTLMLKIFNILQTLFLILLAAFIAATIIIRVLGKTPNVGGFMIFRVSSGSMEPKLNVGDIVLNKKIKDVSTLKVGDIITYEGRESGFSGKLVTHEVVVAPYEENGTYYLVTKGIANTENDPRISENQVVGILVGKIPLINYFFNFFLTPWGLIVTIFVIILTFLPELWSIYKLSRMPYDDEEQELEQAQEPQPEQNKVERKNLFAHTASALKKPLVSFTNVIRAIINKNNSEN